MNAANKANAYKNHQEVTVRNLVGQQPDLFTDMYPPVEPESMALAKIIVAGLSDASGQVDFVRREYRHYLGVWTEERIAGDIVAQDQRRCLYLVRTTEGKFRWVDFDEVAL